MNNNFNQRKRTSKEKRILAGSICIAATIVAGSTFAWFTSTDEVTNKLSAVGEYGVSITEEFTPPEDWIPGQSIKKKAGAVNTGNVDAFVRMWLTGTMRLVTENPDGTSISTFKNLTLEGSSLGGKFKSKDANNNYYRELSDSERIIMQTGELVYAGDSFEYTPEKTGVKVTLASHKENGAVKIVDSKSFTPTGTGLYIFRRNINAAEGVGTEQIEYSGYYCKTTESGSICYALVDTTANKQGGESGQDKQIYVNGLSGLSGSTLQEKIEDGTTLKIRNATESTIPNSGLTWTYKTVAEADEDKPFAVGTKYIQVTIKNPIQGTGQDSIKINIELANISDNGTETDSWQPIYPTNDFDKCTFYYTNDLQSGAISKELIENVNLDTSLKEGSCVAFDFDLDVNLESIQIVKEDDNKETALSVKDGWTTDDDYVTAAKPAGVLTYDADNKEIDTITWVKAAT